MIIELTLKKDEKTNRILSEASDYDPSQDVKDRTAQVMNDFQLANSIRNKPYREFNDVSLIQRMGMDQRSWNQFVEAPSSDPTQAWRSRAFRPIVRNKIITIAAHLTASLLFPKVYARDENSIEDEASAEVMRDLMEWAADESEYEKTFLYSIIAGMVNPACIVHTEYTEVLRTVKEMKEDGTYTEKEIVDTLFSGFQDCVVPTDELWIADIYEHSVQKQPYLIWRRVIDYATARAKYKDSETFTQHVKPGLQCLYSNENNMFYNQYDENLRGTLVEEVIYYNRTADLQLVFINGILINDVDTPNPRDDKMYPFVKTGYELIDEGRFFYYKSLAFKLAPDEEIVNTAYRMVTDGTYIQIMPPAIVFGNEEISSSVIAPGMVTTIDNSQNPNASFQTIATNNNLTAGYNLLEKVEGSISESSAQPIEQGMASSGQQTAFEISRLEQNARTLLGLFGKMIGFMIKDYGTLRMSDIIQFLTIAEVGEIAGMEGALSYKKFVLPERTVDGKTKTKRIEFDGSLPETMSEEEVSDKSMQILMEETKGDNKTKIAKVNPSVFRKLQFKCTVSPEALAPKSDALKKALLLEEYGYAMNNPLTNKESITRDLLLGAYEKTKDNPDDYMTAPQQGGMMPQGQSPQPAGNPAVLAGESANTTKKLANSI